MVWEPKSKNVSVVFNDATFGCARIRSYQKKRCRVIIISNESASMSMSMQMKLLHVTDFIEIARSPSYYWYWSRNYLDVRLIGGNKVGMVNQLDNRIAVSVDDHVVMSVT